MRSRLPFGLATAVALALALAPGLAGCDGVSSGSTTRPATLPVRGKVTRNGKPLTRGRVTFEPDAGREAFGEIGPDGSFSLSTFAKNDGAVPGAHRVAVIGGDRGVPVRYASLGASKLEVDVTEGKSDYTIDLK